MAAAVTSAEQGQHVSFDADPAEDVWALGMIMLELASGKPYFKSKEDAWTENEQAESADLGFLEEQ